VTPPFRTFLPLNEERSKYSAKEATCLVVEYEAHEPTELGGEGGEAKSSNRVTAWNSRKSLSVAAFDRTNLRTVGFCV
jgi:hypothetical protein